MDAFILDQNFLPRWQQSHPSHTLSWTIGNLCCNEFNIVYFTHQTTVLTPHVFLLIDEDFYLSPEDGHLSIETGVEY